MYIYKHIYVHLPINRNISYNISTYIVIVLHNIHEIDIESVLYIVIDNG